jgi:Fe(3+) dicitrate transport protein
VYQLAVGARYSDAYTHRKNDGMGSALALFDDSPVTDVFGKDLMYDNRNAAAYLENQVHVGNALTISPALRLENLTSIARGYTVAADGDFRPVEKRRSFLLAGVGVQYEWENTNLYSNVSQAYRPFTFGDLTPASTTDSIDANLKDASGFNAEFGYRGTYKNWLNFDVGLFYLLYDNRIGVVQQDGVNVKTNIGTSVSKGLEIYLEFDPLKFSSLNNRFGSLNVFVSGTWMDARYIRWENPTLANDPEKSIENKRVEYAPKYVWRGGINYKLGKIHVGLQASYTDELYTDAPNTVLPSPNALVGKIDSYLLCDATVKLVFSPSLFVQSSLNNISDTHYATRRSGGYPGPGLLPGNGRSVTLTLGINL